MTRIEEIKNEVAKEQYDCSWLYACTFMHAGDVEHLMKEVAARYTRECAKASLEKASSKAKIIVSNGETHLDVKSYTLSDGIRFSPDRRGITHESNIVLL